MKVARTVAVFPPPVERFCPLHFQEETEESDDSTVVTTSSSTTFKTSNVSDMSNPNQTMRFSSMDDFIDMSIIFGALQGLQQNHELLVSSARGVIQGFAHLGDAEIVQRFQDAMVRREAQRSNAVAPQQPIGQQSQQAHHNAQQPCCSVRLEAARSERDGHDASDATSNLLAASLCGTVSSAAQDQSLEDFDPNLFNEGVQEEREDDASASVVVSSLSGSAVSASFDQGSGGSTSGQHSPIVNSENFGGFNQVASGAASVANGWNPKDYHLPMAPPISPPTVEQPQPPTAQELLPQNIDTEPTAPTNDAENSSFSGDAANSGSDGHEEEKEEGTLEEQEQEEEAGPTSKRARLNY